MAVKTTEQDILKLVAYNQRHYKSIYPSAADVIDHLFFCIGNGYKIDKGRLKYNDRGNHWSDIRKHFEHETPEHANVLTYDAFYKGLETRLNKWQRVYLRVYQQQLLDGNVTVSGFYGPFDHFDFESDHTYGVCAADFEFLDNNPEIKQIVKTYVEAARDFFATLYNTPEIVLVDKHHEPGQFNRYLERLSGMIEDAPTP